MPQMAVAMARADLGSHHAMAGVGPPIAHGQCIAVG
jgi:hypothetical protein